MTAKKHQEQLEKNTEEFLRLIGEDPARPGLQKTPKRFALACTELFRGYDEKQQPKVTVFANQAVNEQEISDEGVFYTYCEHHLIPFFGTYTFTYKPHPQGKLLGLSKVARVIDYFSAKLQVQERLGEEVVNCLWEALSKEAQHPPISMELVLQAQHLCKCMRGVKKEGRMTTKTRKEGN